MVKRQPSCFLAHGERVSGWAFFFSSMHPFTPRSGHFALTTQKSTYDRLSAITSLYGASGVDSDLPFMPEFIPLVPEDLILWADNCMMDLIIISTTVLPQYWQQTVKDTEDRYEKRKIFLIFVRYMNRKFLGGGDVH